MTKDFRMFGSLKPQRHYIRFPVKKALQRIHFARKIFKRKWDEIFFIFLVRARNEYPDRQAGISDHHKIIK